MTTSPDTRPGCVQIYTGDGKGKTTAALGLALRAAGAGLRVFLGQFAKGRRTSELEALDRFADLITVRQWGRDCFLTRPPDSEEVRLAREGLQQARAALTSGEYELVILDEANVAADYGLLRVEDLLELIACRAPATELVLTGRGADPRVIAAADLVTEMREVKHYWAQGVPSRRGIEE